jgi:hypothetical protein
LTDIFISYAREDQSRVRDLVTVLEKCGWSVFWAPKVRPGQKWRDHIFQALQASRCIVVVWSRHSKDSSWVLEEATVGENRGMLVPVLLDPVEIPFGFGQTQAADLTNWRIDKPSEELDLLVQELRARLKDPPLPSGSVGSDQEVPITYSDNPSGRMKQLAIASAAIVIIGCVIGYGFLRVRSSPPPDRPGVGKTAPAGEEGRPQPKRVDPVVQILGHASATPSSLKLPGAVEVSLALQAAKPGVVSIRYILGADTHVYFKGTGRSVSNVFELPVVEVHEVGKKVDQRLELIQLGGPQWATLEIKIEIRSAGRVVGRGSCVIGILDTSRKPSR